MDKRIMTLVPDGKAFDFAKDLFPMLMAKGYGIGASVMSGYWCDIGTPREYHRCNLDALDGKLALTAPLPRCAPMQPEEEHTQGIWREIPCRDRAKLMRCMSQALMEAGADFSNGINLSQNGESIHIFPAENASSIHINICSSDLVSSETTAQIYENLAQKLASEQQA